MFQLKQWINWRPETLPGQAKPAKIPCANGYRIDPMDPARWMTLEEARAIDPQHVAFVLTEADPYFCIDLDHAWNGREWSALATETLAAFPGAYVEVSYSGDGLHVVGRGAPPAGYGTRGAGVELYAHSRMVVLTGTHAQGSPDQPCDLSEWAARHLKAQEVLPALAWTSGPVAEASPIRDDEKLIERMLERFRQ